MKMNKYYKLLAILSILIIVVVSIVLYVNRDRNWKDIESTKQMKVVTIYSPINYYVNFDGDVDGYNYSILKRFADSLDISLEVTVENDLDDCMKSLKKGDYDILLNLLPITSESSSVTSFSNPILYSNLVLIQYKPRYANNDSDFISNLHMLENQKIYVEKGSFNSLTLRNLRSELGVNFDIIELENVNIEMLCGMIIQDEIKYVAVDKYAVNSIISNFPLLDASIELGIDQSFAWPINDKELKNQIDDFILRNKNTEWWLQLNKKYL